MHDEGGAITTRPKPSDHFREGIHSRQGGIQVENGTPYKTELGLELFVVKVNNRFERVAILETRPNCKLSRYYPSDRISYRNGIESLLFSLKFSDLDATPIRNGSTNGAGIVGVEEFSVGRRHFRRRAAWRSLQSVLANFFEQRPGLLRSKISH